MKKIFIAGLILLAASCSNKKDDNPAQEVDVKQGTWRISFYWDQKDETSNFTGYALMFGDNGVLMAHKGSSMYTGTWSQTSTKLIISFTDPILGELNDDWLIAEKNSGLIKLKDDNPGQDDQLHLAKN